MKMKKREIQISFFSYVRLVVRERTLGELKDNSTAG